MHHALPLTLAALVSAMACSLSACAAESFQNTDLILGYTNEAKQDPVMGTGTENKRLTSLRLEHFGIHAYGDNYFFADVLNGRDVGGGQAGSFGDDTDNQYAIVWNARLSLSKITGASFSAGPIEDLSLMYRLERASYANYRANMIGPSVNLKVPGFAWFQTSLLFDRQRFTGAGPKEKDGHVFWHTYAILPFEVGGQKFSFAPLAWVNFSRGASKTEVYMEPDLWMKLGESPVDLGLRVQYHAYKHYDRTSPTLMARWNF